MLEDYKIFVEGILIETNRKISFPLYLDLFFPTNFRSHESPQMALLYMDIKLPPPIISSFSKPAKRRNVVILMTDTRTMRMQINQKKITAAHFQFGFRKNQSREILCSQTWPSLAS